MLHEVYTLWAVHTIGPRGTINESPAFTRRTRRFRNWLGSSCCRGGWKNPSNRLRNCTRHVGWNGSPCKSRPGRHLVNDWHDCVFRRSRGSVYRRCMQKSELYDGPSLRWNQWAFVGAVEETLSTINLPCPADALDWMKWEHCLDDMSLLDGIEACFHPSSGGRRWQINLHYA